MDTENKVPAEETEVKEEVKEVTEAAEDAVEETVEAAEEAAEAVEEAAEEAPEVAEEIVEEAAAAEPARKVSSKRIKKTERREAKAARKAANKIEEKNSRPNNALIAILIFGVVVAMFAFVLGYNYFSKPATIAKYIEENGGEESFSNMNLDGVTTANITADGNSMKIEMTAPDDDKALADTVRSFYEGEDGQEQLKGITAYFLTGTKPMTRAFSADATATVKVGDEEINSVTMTYKEAKDYLEEQQKEAEEASAEADTADAEDADDAAEADEAEADDAAETEESGE